MIERLRVAMYSTSFQQRGSFSIQTRGQCRVETVAAVLLVLATSLSCFAQTKAGAKPVSDFESMRKRGFVPADGAGIDAKTKLPTRILHKESGIVLLLIPAGEFQMGSPADEAERGPEERQHRRIIHRPFYIGETEVTVEQFRKFVQATKYLTDAERGLDEAGNKQGAFASTSDSTDARVWTASTGWRNPFPNLKDYRLNDKHPVVQVSWNDAQRFVKHFGMQLPTEAQWEYAIRAGSKTRFFWGNDESGGQGYGNFKDALGRKRFPTWNSSFSFDDGEALLAIVCKYKSNAWKVQDMAGNVSEWCQDVFREDYPKDGTDESAVQGEANAPRVFRGGSWLDAPDFNRSAKRLAFEPQRRRDFIGFRVAVNL